MKDVIKGGGGMFTHWKLAQMFDKRVYRFTDDIVSDQSFECMVDLALASCHQEFGLLEALFSRAGFSDDELENFKPYFICHLINEKFLTDENAFEKALQLSLPAFFRDNDQRLAGLMKNLMDELAEQPEDADKFEIVSIRTLIKKLVEEVAR